METKNEQPVSREGEVTAIAFGKWLIETTVKSTDADYVVHKGENFWTVEQLYNLFQQQL